VKLLPDQDERDLAAALRGLLAAECPTTVARQWKDAEAPSVPPTLWKALAAAGVLGLAVSEEYGGSGGGLTDLGVFCIEAGRALCPTVVHGTVQAGLAVQALGSPAQCAAWLPGLCDGTRTATTSLWNPNDARVITPTLRARRESDAGWRLDGSAEFVADADVADHIVVSAADADTGRTMAFVVPLRTEGVRTEALSVMGGYRAFRVHFSDAAVTDERAVLGEVDDDALRRLANTAVALSSLDLVGVGEAALARTVDYVKLRHQFGRPIASFQAAQHLVANMHIALAAARLASRSAVFWLGRGHIATRETAIARMHAASAAKLVTLDAHQLHGGMGFVVDTDLHLFSERARVLSTIGGGADVAATWLEEDGLEEDGLEEDGS
jgi:alkylation response protein AidB-like acyl-CoA dehydrogenase